MNIISSFLVVIEGFCKAARVTESTLSSRMFNDGKRIGQIRAGADIGVRRLEAGLIWLADNWPEGVDWPADIPRPVKKLEAAE